MLLTLTALCFAAQAVSGREITFPPVSPIAAIDRQQQGPLRHGDHDVDEPIDISGAMFGGLMTYANLPYVHCLAADGEEVEKYDIAVIGAPFDTVRKERNERQCLIVC